MPIYYQAHFVYQTQNSHTYTSHSECLTSGKFYLSVSRTGEQSISRSKGETKKELLHLKYPSYSKCPSKTFWLKLTRKIKIPAVWLDDLDLKKPQRKLRQKRVLPLRHHRSESKALANTLRRHYFGPFPQHPPLSQLFNFSNNHFYLKTLCSNAAVFGINSRAHSAVVSIYTQHTNLQASYTEGGN